STLVVERWTSERGLPQNSVNDILQTRDGYLWIATSGGLARFDGVAFEVFDGEGRTGLPSSRILSLLEDRQGRLWVGTEQGGVALWTGEGFVDPLPEPLGAPTVWALAEDGEGAIWMGTGSGAVRLLDGRLARFGVRDGLPDPWVRSFAVDPDGGLWVATGRGVARRVGARFEPVSSEPAWSVAFTAEGALAGGEHAVVELGAGRRRFAPGPGSRRVFARALFLDSTGVLWIGGERLARWRPGAVALDVDDAERIPGPIHSIAEDREGSLWVGTDGGGLYQLRSGAVSFYGREAGLVGDNALPILEDGEGRIWIGTLCGGLTLWETGRFREVELPADFPEPLCVTSLANGRDGALWVGHLGLARHDADGWRQVVQEPEVGTVHGLLEDARGALWMATEGGLLRRDPDGRIEAVAGLADGPVWALAELADGTLAVGGKGWIGRRSPEGGIERVALGGARPDVPVRDFWQAPDGTLWAATYGAGLARLGRDGSIARVGVDEGLAEPFVSRLLPDDSGALWLSGNRGLSRVRPEELAAAAAGRGRVEPRRVDLRDGMRTAETNGGGQPAGCRARDGRLWFPTVRGVAVLDPQRVESNPLAPPVHVERVEVDGRELAGRGAPLEIEGGADRIEIHYTGLGLARPDRIRFRYRLVGYDARWQEAGTRRFALYTQLPPGSYRFEVLAANEDGVWSPRPASLSLAIAARWFETPWFRLLAALAAVAALWGVQRLWLERLHRRQAELERQVVARTAELSELNQNLERIVSEQTDQIRETRDMAILTLAKLAELRDGTTGEHLERIALYSRRLAEALRDGPFGALGDDFIEELFRSSPLHDIGKVAIPDQILNKPGPLSEPERAIMRTHTTIGGDTLGRVIARSATHSFLAMGREIALGHHERWDGSGYPGGHAGERTPLPARIVALVDAYDAITSARPYKPALSHEEAVERIARDRSAHFDPRLVEAFLGIHPELDRIRREHPKVAG
ncbi:MAG TPA: two-component regulator propeller domain-containing protein, partial [Thermoanaerobaculia bacterium]|nr:two-component regulator propeller domain-containing protein [Thermoanaerobaculia bacterium]